MDIPEGYCQCGCGGKTKVNGQTRDGRGYIKGQPCKFIKNHKPTGDKHHSWKDGTSKDIKGRTLINTPSHPKAKANKFIHEYTLIAEKALGKYLSEMAVVHHHTDDQLVICQDQAYHLLLHQRTRALKTCGHAHWRKCGYCGKYDDPKNLYIPLGKRQSARHLGCRAKYDEFRKKNKSARNPNQDPFYPDVPVSEEP